MTDPVTEAELQAHVDGRLPDTRRREIDAWLKDHPQEAARLDAYRDQSQALREMLAPVAAEPIPPALDLRITTTRRSSWWPQGHTRLAAGIAAVALLGSSLGWTARGWMEPPAAGLGALSREAAASYVVYADDPQRPVEVVAGENGALDQWISSRLAYSVSAPDLTRAGLRLMGGRIVPTEHGPAGMYLYRDASGNRVMLFLRRMRIDRTGRMTGRRENGAQGWTWADDGIGFALFGAQPQAVLHPIADMVRHQYSKT